MAKRMDTINKRKNYKRILPGSYRKTKNENKSYTKFHNHGKRPWKNKVILTQIKKKNRSADMPLRHQRPDYRSLTIRMRTSKQREGHFKTVSIKDKRLANQQKGPNKEIL